MKYIYSTLIFLATIFVFDLTRAHFDKRVHSEIYFKLFDHSGKERKLRQEILNKPLKRNLENQRELHSNAK